MNAQAKKKEHREEDLETRVVRLETGFDYLATKADIANVRTELVNVERRLNDRITNVKDSLRKEMKTDLLYILAAIAALAGLMAKGFHWILSYPPITFSSPKKNLVDAI